jgi:hypothetical protein
MPLNDSQLRAATTWFWTGDFDSKINFIWDNLDVDQKAGLVNRIKSDLQSDLDTRTTTGQAKVDDLINPL